jgi:hypothetical protein
MRLSCKFGDPQTHQELLTLHGRTGLQVFLEALARGNTLFRHQRFHIRVI